MSISLKGLRPCLAPRLLIGLPCPKAVDWSKLPWNRRLGRSVARAGPSSVMLAVSPLMSAWKGMGRVVQVADSENGLGSAGL